jgi:hypothetical protein
MATLRPALTTSEELYNRLRYQLTKPVFDTATGGGFRHGDRNQ